MGIGKLTTDSTPEVTNVSAQGNRFYGALSWVFLVSSLLISVLFLLSHGVIHGVKANVIAIEQLEALFFPGVYWTFAASCITYTPGKKSILDLRCELHHIACFIGAIYRFDSRHCRGTSVYSRGTMQSVLVCIRVSSYALVILPCIYRLI